MTRKLASVRRVGNIEAIEGADKIVKAHVDGWAVITAIDNGIMPGDLVVYFEIDSFLPVEERYEFLRKSCFKSTQHLGDGFRLKTIKLRGQISQGLILPLDRGANKGVPVYQIKGKDGETYSVEEGDDLTEILGVQLYEKPIPANLSGTVRGYFPMLIRKTDQERIQNLAGELLHDLDAEWEVSLKLDGSSMTSYHKGGDLGVCSRNLDLMPTEENLFWQINNRLRLHEMLKWLGRNYAFQGELMGPGVQGNREWLKQHSFFLYDIWDIDAQRYLSPEDRTRIVKAINDSGFELPHVHIFGTKKLREFGNNKDDLVNNLLQYAEGPSMYNSIREGLVFKRFDGALSFKVISQSFLLGEKD